MTFLAPMAGLVGALVAVPLLALLYFLKLRRRPVRVSSTLLWESAVRDLQANAPFRWIRPSLLLLLQLLALACLLAALARPALNASDGSPARLVILIDRSASMSAALSQRSDGRASRTRLDEAKDRAKEAVERMARAASPLPGGTRPEAMVIAFAATAQGVTPFTSNTTSLLRAIDAISPTDQPARLDRALRVVAPQFASIDESESTAAEVVLFSDGAFAPANDGEDGRASVGAASFRYVAIGAPAPSDPGGEPLFDNVGIVAFSVQRDFRTPALLRVFARAINAGGQTIEAPATLRLGDRPVGARVLTLPPATPAGPGELAFTFEVEDAQEGLLLLSIDRADLLASDNQAGAIVERPRPTRVLLVRPDAGTPGDQLAARSLERAIEEIAGVAPTVVDPGGYEAITQTPGRLSTIDLVVFDRVAPRRPPSAPSLSLGAGIPVDGLAIAPADTAAGSARFLSWMRSDPLLRNVGLDAVALADAPHITAANESSGVRAQPLASGDGGTLIARARDGAFDRVVVSFPLAQSTWPLQTSFVVFLANVFDTITAAGEASLGRSWTTSAPVALRALPGATSITLAGPDARTAPVIDGGGDVLVGPLERIGVYTQEGGVGDRTLAVNLLDATESALRVAQEVIVDGRSTRASAPGESAPREVWHLFVALAFILLALEWLLYAWRTRA